MYVYTKNRYMVVLMSFAYVTYAYYMYEYLYA